MLKRKKKILAIIASITALITISVSTIITANAESGNTTTENGKVVQSIFINLNDITYYNLDLEENPASTTVPITGMQIKWTVGKGIDFVAPTIYNERQNKIEYPTDADKITENDSLENIILQDRPSTEKYIAKKYALPITTQVYTITNNQIDYYYPTDYIEIIIIYRENYVNSVLKRIESITAPEEKRYVNQGGGWEGQSEGLWQQIKDDGNISDGYDGEGTPKVINLIGYDDDRYEDGQTIGYIFINGQVEQNGEYYNGIKPKYSTVGRYEVSDLAIAGKDYAQGYQDGINSTEVQSTINYAKIQAIREYQSSAEFHQAITNAEKRGQQEYISSQEYTNELYRQYQSGITQGINQEKQNTQNKVDEAYQNGYNEGIAENNPNTFGALFGAIADTPISIIDSVLNYEFLGVNIKNLLGSVLAIGLAVAVIKFIV